MQERKQPALKRAFREPLQTVMRDIYMWLKSVAIGPQWRMYVTDDGVYLQRYNPESKQYESRFLFKDNGDLEMEGLSYSGVALDDVGRK